MTVSGAWVGQCWCRGGHEAEAHIFCSTSIAIKAADQALAWSTTYKYLKGLFGKRCVADAHEQPTLAWFSYAFLPGHGSPLIGVAFAVLMPPTAKGGRPQNAIVFMAGYVGLPLRQYLFLPAILLLIAASGRTGICEFRFRRHGSSVRASWRPAWWPRRFAADKTSPMIVAG